MSHLHGLSPRTLDDTFVDHNEQIFIFMQQMHARMNELTAVNFLRFKFHIQGLMFVSLNWFPT